MPPKLRPTAPPSWAAPLGRNEGIAENRLLLELLRIRSPRRERIDFLVGQADLNWRALHARIARFGVKHVVYSQLKTLGILSRAPEWFCTDCEADYFKNGARNTIILADAAQLRDVFTQAGVDLLFLKGAGLLLSGVYPNSGLRTLSDLDVLVREEDLERGQGQLKHLGYRAATNLRLSPKEYRRQKQHLMPMISPRGVPVEIHWCFEPYGQGENVDRSTLWESARLEGGYRVPSPENMLLNAFIHLAKADLFTFDALLKTYLDCEFLLARFGKELDPSVLIGEIQRRGLMEPVALSYELLDLIGLEEAKALLPIPPAAVHKRYRRIRRRAAAYLLHDEPRSAPDEAALAISLWKETHLARKFKLMSRIAFPDRAYLGKRSLLGYWLTLSRRAVALLWPHRLFSLLRTRSDWAQAFVVVATSLQLPLYQRLLSLDRMMRRLDDGLPSTETNAWTGENFSNMFSHSLAICDWFLGLGRGCFQPTCLKRSLVMFHLLRRQHIPVQVHFGVRALDTTKGRILDGHAWLTLEGHALLDDHGEKFTETYRYPA